MKLSNLFIAVFFTGLVLAFGCSTQQTNSNANNETGSSEVTEVDIAEVQEKPFVVKTSIVSSKDHCNDNQNTHVFVLCWYLLFSV